MGDAHPKKKTSSTKDALPSKEKPKKKTSSTNDAIPPKEKPENKAPSSKDANPPKEKPKNTAPSSKDVNPPKEKPGSGFSGHLNEYNKRSREASPERPETTALALVMATARTSPIFRDLLIREMTTLKKVKKPRCSQLTIDQLTKVLVTKDFADLFLSGHVDLSEAKNRYALILEAKKDLLEDCGRDVPALDSTDAWLYADGKPSSNMKKCDSVLVGKCQRVRRDVKAGLKVVIDSTQWNEQVLSLVKIKNTLTTSVAQEVLSKVNKDFSILQAGAALKTLRQDLALLYTSSKEWGAEVVFGAWQKDQNDECKQQQTFLKDMRISIYNGTLPESFSAGFDWSGPAKGKPNQNIPAIREMFEEWQTAKKKAEKKKKVKPVSLNFHKFAKAIRASEVINSGSDDEDGAGDLRL